MGLPEESNKTYLTRKIEVDDVYLLKKIEEATEKNNKAGNVVFAGVVIVIAFFFVCIFLGFLSFFGLIETLGWLIIIGGVIGTKYADNQRKSYFRKLKVIPNFTTVCPNCKKNLPAYYADKCIFCGYNPYHPERKIKGQPFKRTA